MTPPLLSDYDYRTTKYQRQSAPDSIAVFLCLKFPVLISEKWKS
nr:MAG TPA: hypothetical protein [Bacteriophage sp.]